MKIKKTAPSHIAAAMILSTAFLLAGCGSNTQKETFYSNSAAESCVDSYKIGTDGFTPELIDSFAAVAHLERDEPVFTYSQNGNEITEEEYNANIQGCEIALTALDWIRIQ